MRRDVEEEGLAKSRDLLVCLIVVTVSIEMPALYKSLWPDERVSCSSRQAANPRRLFGSDGIYTRGRRGSFASSSPSCTLAASSTACSRGAVKHDDARDRHRQWTRVSACYSTQHQGWSSTSSFDQHRRHFGSSGSTGGRRQDSAALVFHLSRRSTYSTNDRRFHIGSTSSQEATSEPHHPGHQKPDFQSAQPSQEELALGRQEEATATRIRLLRRSFCATV